MTQCAPRPITSGRNGMLEPGAQAHCKRVAAWCEELALVLDIPGNDASALQEAALMHHHPITFLQGSGYSKLADDLGYSGQESSTPGPRLMSMDAQQIIIAFRGKAKNMATKRAHDLAHIL